MTVTPIQKGPPQSHSEKARFKPISQGLAKVPDRLEDRRVEEPPSLFKEFLFKPIFEVIKFLIRKIFTFVDFLHRVSFEENAREKSRGDFLHSLSSAPRPEKLLLQFKGVYSLKEQNRIYRAIGEAHSAKISWKELVWDRTPEENIELGCHLVEQNPFLLRDYLT